MFKYLNINKQLLKMGFISVLFFRWGPRLRLRAPIKEVSSKARHDVMGRALGTAPYLLLNQKSYSARVAS